MKPALRFYLLAYNFLAFTCWLLYLVFYGLADFQLNVYALVFLNIAQGMAVLEILNVMLKWVKSPLISTVAQVSSRLLVLMLINIFMNQPDLVSQASLGLEMVTVAWVITELVRYSFYFFAQLKIEVKALVWMRYSFFVVLYPLGVCGEWVIISAPTLNYGFSFNAYSAFVIIAIIAYGYFFPKLYRYMFKQRNQKL